MRIDQVTKLLNGVMTKFFAQISDKEVIEAIRRGYITGGCIN